MKDALKWMGEHPVLTVIILMVVADGLVNICRALRG